MSQILLVLGSAREGRAADGVGQVIKGALEELGAEVSVADLKQINLPFFDEAKTPSDDSFEFNNQAAKDWSAMVQTANGVIFLTPEYNHGTSGILKNAIDWLYKEWADKPVTVVGYGWSGAPFARTHLSDTLNHLKTKLQEDTASLCFMKEINVDGCDIDGQAKEAVLPRLKEFLASL